MDHPELPKQILRLAAGFWRREDGLAVPLRPRGRSNELEHRLVSDPDGVPLDALPEQLVGHRPLLGEAMVEAVHEDQAPVGYDLFGPESTRNVTCTSSYG
jgi:hypothetical protein